MRVKGIIASSIRPASAPTVSISSTTNFNQNRATFNGTVSANGAVTTTIKFQISTNGGSTWVDASGGTTITNTSSQGVSVFYNATGLSENTTYTVRLVATNSAGTTNSGTTSFTTWSLKTFARTTAGSESLTVPTITPTGQSPVAPIILEVFVVGGGGGAGYGGGGAGGFYLNTGSESFSSGSNTVINITVGGGGGAQSAGGGSSITGVNLTSRNGNGGGGGSPAQTGSGGNSGNGFTGGVGAFGMNYGGKSGDYVDTNMWAAGGGASYGANGNSAYAPGVYGIRPGNGQNGGGAFGYNGGSGGRAYGQEYSTGYYGTLGTHSGGFGSGGEAINGAGVHGVVTFKYYGP